MSANRCTTLPPLHVGTISFYCCYSSLEKNEFTMQHAMRQNPRETQPAFRFIHLASTCLLLYKNISIVIYLKFSLDRHIDIFQFFNS